MNVAIVRIVEDFLRLLLGGAFLYAGLSKTGDPANFQQDILAYRVIESYPATAILAIWLPWLEILTGGLVLLGIFRSAKFPRLQMFDFPAITILTGLMLVFSLAYLSTLVRGFEIGCGCFGEAMQEWPPLAIIARDIVLLLSGLTLLYLRRGDLGKG